LPKVQKKFILTIKNVKYFHSPQCR